MKSLVQYITESKESSIHKIADKGDYMEAFKQWLIWDTESPEEDKRSGVLAQEFIDKNGSRKGLVNHLMQLIKDKKDEELVAEYEDFVKIIQGGETYYAIRQEKDGTIVWDDLA